MHLILRNSSVILAQRIYYWVQNTRNQIDPMMKTLFHAWNDVFSDYDCLEHPAMQFLSCLQKKKDEFSSPLDHGPMIVSKEREIENVILDFFAGDSSLKIYLIFLKNIKCRRNAYYDYATYERILRYTILFNC